MEQIYRIAGGPARFSYICSAVCTFVYELRFDRKKKRNHLSPTVRDAYEVYHVGSRGDESVGPPVLGAGAAALDRADDF